MVEEKYIFLPIQTSASWPVLRINQVHATLHLALLVRLLVHWLVDLSVCQSVHKISKYWTFLGTV